MAGCSTCGAACGPEPFRCSCQRDCWIGDPAAYDECIAACAAIPDCDRPGMPTLPSNESGDRCPVEGYDDCVAAAGNARTAAENACDDGSATYCECLAEAAAVEQEALRDCELAALPFWLQCLKDGAAEEAGCCGTPLSDCDDSCVNVFIDAVEPAEEEFFTTRRNEAAARLRSFHMDPFCTGTFDSCCLDVIAQLEQVPPGVTPECYAIDERYNFDICRATCERDEIRRASPGDRKTSHCGSREYLCHAVCAAKQISDERHDYCDQRSCAELCAGDDDVPGCVFDCEVAQFEARRTRQLARLGCDFGCCQQEHTPARHGYTKDSCEYVCTQARFAAALDCAAAKMECLVGARSPSVIEHCDDLYEACLQQAEDDDKACRREHCYDLIGDCPDCFEFDGNFDEPPSPPVFCGCCGCGCAYCAGVEGCAHVLGDCELECNSTYNNCAASCAHDQEVREGFCDAAYFECVGGCPPEGEDGHEACLLACAGVHSDCLAGAVDPTCLAACEDVRTPCLAACADDNAGCLLGAANANFHCREECDIYYFTHFGFVCGDGINPDTGVEWAWPDDC